MTSLSAGIHNVAYDTLELIPLLQETAKSLCRIPSSVPPR